LLDRRYFGPSIPVVFGLFWAISGSSSLPGVPRVLGYLLAVVIAGILLRALRRAARTNSGEAPSPRTRVYRIFYFVVAAEVVGILVAVRVCVALGRPEAIAGLIALVVGLHFVPLARIFRVKVYYGTAAVLCLVTVVTWALAPIHVVVQGTSVDLWTVIPALGSAVGLWGTGAMIVWGAPRKRPAAVEA
jgi:hypothetical protein